MVILVDLSVVETPDYVIGKPKISGAPNGTGSQPSLAPSTNQNQFSSGSNKVESSSPNSRLPLNTNMVNTPNGGSRATMMNGGGKPRYGYDQSLDNNTNHHRSGKSERSYETSSFYGDRAGPIAKNEGHARIIPISQLNPYMNRWTIKGRLTAKSTVRTWNKGGNTGRVRSVDFLDDQVTVESKQTIPKERERESRNNNFNDEWWAGW